jgi:transposase-like protein
MMAERGLVIDHSALNRRVVHYAPTLERPSRKRRDDRVIGGEWMKPF